LRDVLVVAASGNNKTGWSHVLNGLGQPVCNPRVNEPIQFPASDPRALAVGGVELGPAGSLTANLWDQQIAKEQSPYYWPPFSTVITDDISEFGTNIGSNLGIVAPARDIISTMYPTFDYSQALRCGTSTSFTGNYYVPGGVLGLTSALNPERKYGVCTGTSFSAPYASGLAGLMRSYRPLVLHHTYQSAKRSMRKIFAETARIHNGTGAYPQGTYNTAWGFGVPRGALVSNALQAISYNWSDPNFSRLTPLLTPTHAGELDNFYTTVPSMASAARDGNLLWPRTVSMYYCATVNAPLIDYRNIQGYVSQLPSENGGEPVCSWPLPPEGQTSTGYVPQTCGCQTHRNSPKRAFWVFTAPKDADDVSLYALYRYSFVSSDGITGRHVYLTRPISCR
jgi:Subtilase family